MPKLHELIAVEGDAREQSTKTRTELVHTFDKKRHLFAEKVVTFQSNVEGTEPVREEQLDLQSSIAAELKWISGIWGKAIDLGFQVDEGNTKARADVVLDNGATFAQNVPATALLQLEKRLGDLLTFVMAVPTLDPAKGFQLDPQKGAGIYKAREVRKARTKKTVEVITKAPATDKHPAQTELLTVDKEVGTIVEQEWSGLITPATKAEYVGRVEALRRAVKAARARANETEVAASVKIADKIFDYVFAEVK